MIFDVQVQVQLQVDSADYRHYGTGIDFHLELGQSQGTQLGNQWIQQKDRKRFLHVQANKAWIVNT